MNFLDYQGLPFYSVQRNVFYLSGQHPGPADEVQFVTHVKGRRYSCPLLNSTFPLSPRCLHSVSTASNVVCIQLPSS